MRGSFTWRHADFFEFFFYGLKNYNRGMVFVEGFIYKLHGDMKSYFTNVKRVVLKEGWTLLRVVRSFTVTVPDFSDRLCSQWWAGQWSESE